MSSVLHLLAGHRLRRVAVALAAASTGGCAAHAPPAAAPEIRFITPTRDWPFPFSPAVRVGHMVYLSGQIGTRMENGRPVLVPGGIEAETRQTLENIRAIVQESGSSMDRVVKCTVMMADMADWPRMNTIYASYFPGPKPARSALGANGLALGARVEIECIAVAR